MKTTVCFVVMLLALCVFPCPAAENISWTGEGLRAWMKSSSQCANLRMDGDALKGTVTGSDPQLSLTLPKPIVPKGNHAVRLRMKFAGGGRCQMFWRHAENAAFSESRQRDFNLKTDGAWHDYRVFLDWCGGGDVVALRFDLPGVASGSADFELNEIRIEEIGTCLNDDVTGKVGVAFRLQMPPGFHYCTIEWGGLECGRGFYPFMPATDGAPHDYWFDLRDARPVYSDMPGRQNRTWRGTIVRCDVRQARLSKSLPVENLRVVTQKPNLAPDLTIVSARPCSAIPRAGRPFELETLVRNLGTHPAKNIRFSFEGLPTGVKMLDAAQLSPTDPLAENAGHSYLPVEFRYCAALFASDRAFRLRLSDLGSGHHEFTIAVSADGIAPRRTVVRVDVLPSLNLKRADYPGKPQKVDTSPYEIGTFLFPGWRRHAWHAVGWHAPWRKPVLGWYDEDDPKTMDWQIKHLVENGISFVSVDWYWSAGKPHPNLWMTSFAKARYRTYLKWSVMWANHNAPGTHSVADQEAVTRYWIDNYFGDPQYQRIDGKPVVFIWDPFAMERDMKGKGGCHALIEISQRLAKDAGFKGIHFVAIRGTDREDAPFLSQFAEMGFDRTTVYRYLGEGVTRVPTREDGSRTFADLASSSLEHWRTLNRHSRIPFMPSLTTGWDNRPWLGEVGWHVSGTNPADFRRICRDAKTFSDDVGERVMMMGPMDEWGEGEIGAPNAEHGFGMLEAIRDTFGRKSLWQRFFGWPVNHAPEDIGLAH